MFLARTFARLVPWFENWRYGVEDMNVEKSPFWEEIRAGQAREDILKLLRVRFGTVAVAEFSPILHRVDDLPTLNRWFDLVASGSLEEVRVALGNSQAVGS